MSGHRWWPLFTCLSCTPSWWGHITHPPHICVHPHSSTLFHVIGTRQHLFTPHLCPSCWHVLYMFLCIMVKYIFLFHVVCVSVSSYRQSSWTPASKISQRDTTSSPLLLLHSYSLTQHDNLDMVNASAVHIQHHKDHMKYNETFSTSKSLAPHESLSLLSELPA